MMAEFDDPEMAPEIAAVASDAFRDAMARLAGAVHVVTTDGPGGRAGFTASAVCSVTDAPPTLLVCVNRGSSSYPVFGMNGTLCVNTLSAEHQDVASAFGGRVPWDERFASADWRAGAAGQPVLAGALAAFECRIVDAKTVGTHDVLFCEVAALASPTEADALLYANRRYHALPGQPAEPEAAGRFEGASGSQRRGGRRLALRIA